jgi:threonine dehydrogenase-like Zn-dependent dehydrogenase
VRARLQACLPDEHGAPGADLTYELSGNPLALDQAIAVTGFNGRVVIGSWYGQKHADLNLGGRFHRSRIRLISSQVSTIAPEWSGRWTKSRRLHVAWEMLQHVRPAHLITHRFPLAQASQAYALLDQHPEEAIQVLFTYGE